MTGRHQPEQGADSAAAWQPAPWRVTMCDRFEPDIRFDVRIPAAIGKNDAIGQARERYPGCSALQAVPA